MEIPTVLGIQWRMASASDILTLAGILLIPVVILIIIRLYNRHKKHAIHDSQLFLFRLKRLGLSNFQIKIVDNLVSILVLKNPTPLLKNAELFESATGRFMSHLRRSGEGEDSLTMICRDLTIIYDRLYHPTRLKMPLKSVHDIDGNQLIYFNTLKPIGAGGTIFLGKITSSDSRNLYVITFGDISDARVFPTEEPAEFHIFRPGDAEYHFSAPVTARNGNTLTIPLPTEIIRGDISRHPYIDVIISAELYQTGIMDEGNAARLGCTIYKINEYEAVLRIGQALDYDSRYVIEFNQMDFNFKITAKIISQKTVEEGGIFYYTLKFEEMSEGAARVLRKYVYENL